MLHWCVPNLRKLHTKINLKNSLFEELLRTTNINGYSQIIAKVSERHGWQTVVST